MSETVNKGGRPTSYKEEYNEQALQLCELGATDKKLSEFFKVNESTINQWKKDFPKFSKSLIDGKGAHDLKIVENSLKNRAIGMEVQEFTYESNGDQEVLKKRVVKQLPPDPTSMKMWLHNRCPDRWREKTEVEHSGEVVNKNVDMSDLSFEQLKELSKGE